VTLASGHASRLLAASLLALLVACSRPAVEDSVTIEFHDDKPEATITARQTFRIATRSAAERARISSAANAAMLGTDPWSVRFDRLQPASEQVTFDRVRGQLERVTHAAVVPAHDVERFFSDSSLTVKYARGEGWGELAIYPGTSNRFTREQQRHFDEALTAWSQAISRYYQSLAHLYGYLAENPQRARFVFAALLSERGVDGAPPLVTEDEQPLVDAVLASMDTIGAKLDEETERGMGFAEEADLIFNPFPAKLTVVAPATILAREGFVDASDARTVMVEQVDLLASLSALEGRWASPDPLLLLLRDTRKDAEELAAIRRRIEPVTSARDIEDAVRAQLIRPKTYLLRWKE
jgi:hypothetical protein